MGLGIRVLGLRVWGLGFVLQGSTFRRYARFTSAPVFLCSGDLDLERRAECDSNRNGSNNSCRSVWYSAI